MVVPGGYNNTNSMTYLSSTELVLSGNDSA
jgi:hypothetical protein